MYMKAVIEMISSYMYMKAVIEMRNQLYVYESSYRNEKVVICI